MLETTKHGSSIPVGTFFCKLKIYGYFTLLSTYFCRFSFRKNSFFLKVSYLSSIHIASCKVSNGDGSFVLGYFWLS